VGFLRLRFARLYKILKQNNLKATVQRTAILKSINDAGHINIDGIYSSIRSQYPTISLATVYKI